MPRSPGISVDHVALPQRRYGLVRGDIAAIVGFIRSERWPTDAVAGDFIELTLRCIAELTDHPLRDLFDRPSRTAVRCFFENGGEEAHLFGVCIRGEEDLVGAPGQGGVLAPLLDHLRSDEGIGLLACPSAASLPCRFDRLGHVRCDVDDLYDELLDHCREMDNRFMVLDPPRGLHGAALLYWLDAFRSRKQESRAFGALYYPWLHRGMDLVPPSGAVLGVFARTEREHSPYGVAWPPANVPLRGHTYPEVDLGWNEVSDLASHGGNPLVAQPGRGVVVFGARTLSSEPRWEFINARRIVSMIGEQLRRDNEWVVFEQNDPMMWKVLERDVGARLDEFWEQGMLTGTAARKDYSVRCDAEINPRQEREAGRMNVEVMLRPVGTTEHITLHVRLGEGGA